jgi:hypothetical protein
VSPCFSELAHCHLCQLDVAVTPSAGDTDPHTTSGVIGIVTMSSTASSSRQPPNPAEHVDPADCSCSARGPA